MNKCLEKKSKTFIWECEYDVWSWMNNKLFAYHIYFNIIIFEKHTQSNIFCDLII